MTRPRSLWALPAIALLATACSDEGPIAPAPSVVGTAELLSCQADVRTGEISCAGEDGVLGEGAFGAIIGGQGVYVQLNSSNVGYDSGTEIFSAAVTVHNLSNQVIGSSDGVSPHADGIRIFFVGEPTVVGSGEVTVRGADGLGNFSGSNQPYYQYAQALGPGQSSLARTWEWNVPTGVTSFSFLVGLSAEVADEAGLLPGLAIKSQVISADTLHSCALDLSGQTWCWGRGQYGRLGNSETDPKETPVPVQQGALRFVSISVGHNYGCGLTAEGKAWCWGYGGNGRLGNGSTSNQFLPTEVSGGHTFKELSAGRQFACGVDIDGKGWCWGINTYGQIGDGSTSERHEPVEVVGGHTFTSIATGEFHTCGVTDTGATYCWGSQNNGKLGNGETSSGSVPEPFPVLGGHTFASVYPTLHHTCALTPEGEAWCWGSQNNGKLGNGETAGSTFFAEPQRVVTDERFISLSTAVNHVCGVTFDGRGLCWGSNARGKAGWGTIGGTSGFPTEVVAVDNFVEISTGGDHSCGATTTGDVYCWGTGGEGRLGIGGTSNVGTPTRVVGLGSIAALDRGYGAPLAKAGDVASYDARNSADRQLLTERSASPAAID